MLSGPGNDPLKPMCLIVFNFTPDQSRHLLLAANRDEFHQRPTRPMFWWNWPDGPLAGRDELAGGTWLALDRSGRWAAVTNFRDAQATAGARSRGLLPLGFLRGDRSPEDYVWRVWRERGEFAPFNLLVGNRLELWYVSRHGRPSAVEPGRHALSNGELDESWPKSRRAVRALEAFAGNASGSAVHGLLDLMDDRTVASDGELPDTGVGLEVERFLSSPFIVGEDYGTRCTSVVSIGTELLVAERRYRADGRAEGELVYCWS